MAAQKLTATKIEKYKPTKNDEILTDGNGLYVRFRKNEFGQFSRNWMYAYKVGTKSVYIGLGAYDSSLSDFETTVYKLGAGAKLTVENARRIAVELTGIRKRGVDPKQFLSVELDRTEKVRKVLAEAESHRQKQIEVEKLTFQELFDFWIRDGVDRKDGNAELLRSFTADVLPTLGKKPLKEVTEHDLRALLRVMVARGVNRAAVVIRDNLAQIFAWAEKRQPWRTLLASGNPVNLIEIEKIVDRDYDLTNQSDRILSPIEIRELFCIFERMKFDYDSAPNKRVAKQPFKQASQHAIWIMLSTMCRVGELSMARWDHIDFNTREWYIPKQNVKGNVAALTVFLSPFALKHFHHLFELTGKTEWCFPAVNKDGHICVKAMSKQVGDRQCMFKKCKDGGPRKPMKNRKCDDTLVLGDGKNGAWTPHDLRRTGATLMQSLGVPLEIIDRCQNHVLPGSKVRRHYLHHNYAQEKLDAWKILGNRLTEILVG